MSAYGSELYAEAERNEQKSLLVLNAVVAGQSTVAEAAASLGLSDRQVRRALAAYRGEGAAALAHGNRGRRPVNATSGRWPWPRRRIGAVTSSICAIYWLSGRASELRLLEGSFTPDELARLVALRQRFQTHPDYVDADAAIRRLEFARWLVQHGKLTED